MADVGSAPAERQEVRSATTRRYQAPRPGKLKKPDGRFGHRASESQEAWNLPTLILIELRLLNLHRHFHLMDLRQYNVFGQAHGFRG